MCKFKQLRLYNKMESVIKNNTCYFTYHGEIIKLFRNIRRKGNEEIISRVNKLYRFYTIFRTVEFYNRPLAFQLAGGDDYKNDIQNDKYGDRHLQFFLQSVVCDCIRLIYRILRCIDKDENLDFDSKIEILEKIDKKFIIDIIESYWI